MIRQETNFGPFSIISMFGFTIAGRIGRAGKEEERAMFQQMQAMAQKQVQFSIRFHMFDVNCFFRPPYLWFRSDLFRFYVCSARFSDALVCMIVLIFVVRWSIYIRQSHSCSFEFSFHAFPSHSAFISWHDLHFSFRIAFDRRRWLGADIRLSARWWASLLILSSSFRESFFVICLLYRLLQFVSSNATRRGNES